MAGQLAHAGREGGKQKGGEHVWTVSRTSARDRQAPGAAASAPGRPPASPASPGRDGGRPLPPGGGGERSPHGRGPGGACEAAGPRREAVREPRPTGGAASGAGRAAAGLPPAGQVLREAARSGGTDGRRCGRPSAPSRSPPAAGQPAAASGLSSWEQRRGSFSSGFSSVQCGVTLLRIGGGGALPATRRSSSRGRGSEPGRKGRVWGRSGRVSSGRGRVPGVPAVRVCSAGRQLPPFLPFTPGSHRPLLGFPAPPQGKGGFAFLTCFDFV